MMEKEILDIRSFIQNFERQFDHPMDETITPQTAFRSLPEWTSLQALVVIISFDEDYGVTISSEELHNAQTMEDLYNLVKDKQID